MFIQKYTPLIARIFIAVIFIQTGIANAIEFADTQQQIADVGIPLSALVALCVVIFEIAGGVSLILGYKVQIGVILLLLFLVPATLVFHNPVADPAEMISFLKNLAIIGGLLMIAAHGPGPVSLERSAAKSKSLQHSEESMR
ncbi:DoxX subfamily, putative [Synechococcus sp. PCC 7335]|uniref:DoxX family protein n=1 Tax=Synechococcus sp. (strain ATCC 29403 / PCC 7335) TaxID=91464 RepID=UPI00017EBCE1|nr:DoxX family protein [Synechococcus sp. PCC 7335]EDX82826.1 DoxX subfamily, putative [Synechococcus sp. PCC 7335]